jgi:hypothetical protein
VCTDPWGRHINAPKRGNVPVVCALLSLPNRDALALIVAHEIPPDKRRHSSVP